MQTKINCINTFEFTCITANDVLQSIKKIKSNAVGYDNVNPKFVQIVLPFILPFLTYTYNNIITRSHYPDIWKYTKIIPIPKTKNECRPIAIIPYLAKVFEGLMSLQIKNFIMKNGLISDR